MGQVVLWFDEVRQGPTTAPSFWLPRLAMWQCDWTARVLQDLESGRLKDKTDAALVAPWVIGD